MTLQNYYNRFNPDRGYDELLFRAAKGLQSAELNEIQSIQSDRLKRLADVLFKDGAVVRDATAVIDSETGDVQMQAGAIYANGGIRFVDDAEFTIPLNTTVTIGIYLTSAEITELEDPELRDPAVGTRNYQEPGAGRLRRLAAWGWSGDGSSGDFYPVYTVVEGVLLDQSKPPEIDGVKQLIARYDREANGNYVVRGLEVVPIGKNPAQTNYLFSILNGTGNLQGYKIDKTTAVTFAQPINPDIQQISNEPKNSTTASAQTVTLNRKPLSEILDVVITKEKTVTLTRGATPNGADALPDTSVLSVSSVAQGGTTYSAGTSYNLVADTISWAPGGSEPATGSTYTVTYRYLTSVTPTSVDLEAGTFSVTGAVASTLILVDYRWKVPRSDTIVLRRDGTFAALKGQPSRFSPVAPQAADSELALAQVYYDWFAASTPQATDVATRVISMEEQKAMKDSIAELYKLAAENRLRNDISSREPSAKYGIFTDNFFDDDLRDAGVSQTAVIVENELQPPATAVIISQPLNNGTIQLLPYNEVSLVEQLLFTGSMKINPYQTFEPMPAKVVLSPAVDQWTETNSKTTTQYLYYPWYYWGYWGYYGAYWWYYNWYWSYYPSLYPYYWYYQPRTTTQLVSRSEQTLPYLRQRSVGFKVSGFGGGEVLAELVFDGRIITQSYVANGDGEIEGSFTVPANVPAGQKLVEFKGGGGSYGAATYYGQGTLIVERYVQNHYYCYWGFDPLAQTFTLKEGRYITSVDLKFAQIGNTSNDVLVQIRETDNGVPTRQVLASGKILGSDLTTDNVWTRCTFDAPVFCEADTEYAVVILTDDANHAVRIGQLGKFDSLNQKWVTAQPYTVGVLLSSSNASTWTPMQDSDLCFRLNGAQFTSANRTVSLGNISVTNATHLSALVPLNVPSGDGEVMVTYTKPSGETLELVPGLPIQLDASYTGTLAVNLKLKGTSTVSPITFPGVQTVVGTAATSGTYVSREFNKAAGGTTLKVIFQARLTGGATVTPTFQNGGSYASMTLVSASEVGDGWAEYVYQATGLSALTSTRVKLELSGSVGNIPKARQLRAVFV